MLYGGLKSIPEEKTNIHVLHGETCGASSGFSTNTYPRELLIKVNDGLTICSPSYIYK